MRRKCEMPAIDFPPFLHVVIVFFFKINFPFWCKTFFDYRYAICLGKTVQGALYFSWSAAWLLELSTRAWPSRGSSLGSMRLLESLSLSTREATDRRRDGAGCLEKSTVNRNEQGISACGKNIQSQMRAYASWIRAWSHKLDHETLLWITSYAHFHGNSWSIVPHVPFHTKYPSAIPVAVSL